MNVIVVDNASGDGTVDLLRTLSVEAIALEENGGFAYGCNVRLARRQLAVRPLPQPGRQIQPDALASSSKSSSASERVGAVAPRIEEPDGSLDYSLRRFPRLRSSFAQALFLHRVFPEATWVDEVIRDPAAYERAHPVEWVSGACFAVRRSVARRDRRTRRELLPLQRGRRHLRADLGGGATRCGYVPAALAEHEGGASAPRSRLLPSSPRAGSATRRSTTSRAVRSPSRERRAGCGHARLARARARRRGADTSRALGVALRPLPAEPSHLVRGT